jgi:hypothetical protein
MATIGRISLSELAERIEAIEGAGRRGGCIGVVDTGWPGQHAHLSRGAVHEWFGLMDGVRHARWTPPLLLMAHLARCALDTNQTRHIIWIGREIHPHAGVLVGEQGHDGSALCLLRRSLFVDADDIASRVWAIDLALRCPAVAAVIADGSGLTMAHTRRLHLAAQGSGGGGVALLARPPSELADLSCAATRWTATPYRAATERERGEPQPRWAVACVRCKGVQRLPASEAASEELLLERDRATGRIRVAADAVHRPDQTTIAQTERIVRRTG